MEPCKECGWLLSPEEQACPRCGRARARGGLPWVATLAWWGLKVAMLGLPAAFMKEKLLWAVPDWIYYPSATAIVVGVGMMVPLIFAIVFLSRLDD